MRSLRRPINWLFSCILMGMLAVTLPLAPPVRARPSPTATHSNTILSPIWDPNIHQWSAYIAVLSDVYGLDPDFIAAVIKEESNGRADLVSEAGAVGLMGIMPAGPGLEWRPPPEELKNPAVNLRWGVGILAEVVRHSGGDLYAALAAYSGGWAQVNGRVPRAYAARVLDNYGQAIMARDGRSPAIASQWTVAVEIKRGFVPQEPLLVLGQQPAADLHLFGKHVAYNAVDTDGKAYYIIAYAVPMTLVVPLEPGMGDVIMSQTGDIKVGQPAPPLLGNEKDKTSSGAPHILIACLPSLDRLRGQSSTRWFAPSQCPPPHR